MAATMHAWGPFVLMMPDADVRRAMAACATVPLDGAVLVWAGDGPMLAWPSGRVLVRLLTMASSHLLAEKHVLAEPSGLDMDAIKTWARMTRDLAARWPYGTEKRDLLVRTVESIERTFVLRDFVRRDRWPTTAARIEQFRTSLCWWAAREFDHGLAVVCGRPGRATSLTRFVENLDGLIRLDLPEFAAHRPALQRALASASIGRRIRDCGARLRPDAASNVCAWLLRDALLGSSPHDCGRFALPAGTLSGVPNV